jgi:hypothetical protein
MYMRGSRVGVILNFLLIGVFVLAGHRGAQSQQRTVPQTGEVTGLLVDEEGLPVKGFLVSILGASPTSTFRQEATTDSNGKFHAAGLNYGDYVTTSHVDAPDSRYPPGASSFFDKNLVRFTINSSSQQAKVLLHRDPPLQIIKGRIVDNSTYAPLVADIKMWHEGDSTKWVRFSSDSSGAYRCWLPHDKPVVLEVHANGYHSYLEHLSAGHDDLEHDVRMEAVDIK